MIGSRAKLILQGNNLLLKRESGRDKGVISAFKP